VSETRRRSHWTRGSALALAVALTIGASAARGAGKDVLKFATLAPQGSVWDTGLREMGAAWSKATAGRVELRLYPGGVAGDEADVVRKIRIGQFQGAALTVTGLAELDPSFRVFHLPMLFASWEELAAVLAGMRPELERRLEAKGFVLLSWGHGGWVHLFSRTPIRTVDDLKKVKLFVWAGDDAQVQQWRRNGYQPVPLAATDVTMGFQTQMIDVVPTTPIAALTLQWFRQAPNMLALGLAPLVGAVVVTKPSWDGAAGTEREALRAAAAALEARLAREVPKTDAASIEQMQGRGLVVNKVSTEEEARWRAAAEAFSREAREGGVPKEILDQVRTLIGAHRKGGSGG
jgi:TRAP-type C4-dicarboxylate transport system substrate-binding protein